jgi:hypothetical protein
LLAVAANGETPLWALRARAVVPRTTTSEIHRYKAKLT